MSLHMMQEVVYGAKKGLKKIVDEFGTSSVLSYIAGKRKNTFLGEKQAECLEVIVDVTARLWGREIAALVKETLRTDWSASTAEHHAPVSHPFVLSGTFVQALTKQEHDLRAMIVLSSGSISLNNSSFPRGFEYHLPDLSTKRLSFAPWKYRRQPVIAAHACTEEAYCEVLSEARVIDERLYTFLLALKERFLSVDSYADQISLLNEAFWRMMPEQSAMHLVYLPQEEIVKELLLRFHVGYETIISQVLFDVRWREVFAQEYNGLIGAHSNDGGGTFLFWGIQDGLRVGLRLSGDRLISSDTSLSIHLHPEAVSEALINGQIFPNMALSFMVLSFYYGLECGGGFSQVDYLPLHGTAYNRLLEYMKEKAVLLPDATRLSSDFSFVSLQTGTKSVLATGLDMFLYGDTQTGQRIRELGESITLRMALDNLMPEFYPIVRGEPFREQFISAPLPTCLYVPMSLLR